MFPSKMFHFTSRHMPKLHMRWLCVSIHMYHVRHVLKSIPIQLFRLHLCICIRMPSSRFVLQNYLVSNVPIAARLRLSLALEMWTIWQPIRVTFTSRRGAPRAWVMVTRCWQHRVVSRHRPFVDLTIVPLCYHTLALLPWTAPTSS